MEKNRNPELLRTFLASFPMPRYSRPIRTPIPMWEEILRWVSTCSASHSRFYSHKPCVYSAAVYTLLYLKHKYLNLWDQKKICNFTKYLELLFHYIQNLKYIFASKFNAKFHVANLNMTKFWIKTVFMHSKRWHFDFTEQSYVNGFPNWVNEKDVHIFFTKNIYLKCIFTKVLVFCFYLVISYVLYTHLIFVCQIIYSNLNNNLIVSQMIINIHHHQL